MKLKILLTYIRKIKAEFLHPIDDSEMMNNAIKGMIDNLDEYSAFLDKQLFAKFEKKLKRKPSWSRNRTSKKR